MSAYSDEAGRKINQSHHSDNTNGGRVFRCRIAQCECIFTDTLSCLLMLEIQCFCEQLGCTLNFIKEKRYVAVVSCDHCDVILQHFLSIVVVFFRNAAASSKSIIERFKYLDVIGQGLEYRA